MFCDLAVQSSPDTVLGADMPRTLSEDESNLFNSSKERKSRQTARFLQCFCQNRDERDRRILTKLYGKAQEKLGKLFLVFH